MGCPVAGGLGAGVMGQRGHAGVRMKVSGCGSVHLTLRAGGSGWWAWGPWEEGEAPRRPQEKAELAYQLGDLAASPQHADLPGRSFRPPDGRTKGPKPGVSWQVGHCVCYCVCGGGGSTDAEGATGPWVEGDLQSPFPVPLGPFLQWETDLNLFLFIRVYSTKPLGLRWPPGKSGT